MLNESDPGSPPEAFNRLVKIAGSYAAIARRLNLESGYGVSKWREKVPPERVIPLCELVDFQVTPHELRPDLYPYPEDGMPRRSGDISALLDEISQVLTEDEHHGLLAAIARGSDSAQGFLRGFEHRPEIKSAINEILIILGHKRDGPAPAAEVR